MDWTTVAEITTAILLAEAVIALVRHLAAQRAAAHVQTPSEHLNAGASAAGW